MMAVGLGGGIAFFLVAVALFIFWSVFLGGSPWIIDSVTEIGRSEERGLIVVRRSSGLTDKVHFVELYDVQGYVFDKYGQLEVMNNLDTEIEPDAHGGVQSVEITEDGRAIVTWENGEQTILTSN